MRDALAPATMVVAAALPGGGGGTQGGVRVLGAFLGLMDSTHSARLVSESQGVARPTNWENRGGRLNGKTDGLTGGGQNPPPKEMKTVGGQTRSGGYVLMPPLHN